DWLKLADAFGWTGHYCAESSALKDTLEAAFQAAGAVLAASIRIVPPTKASTIWKSVLFFISNYFAAKQVSIEKPARDVTDNNSYEFEDAALPTTPNNQETT
ncbi:MAG: hypothetical protein AAF085_10965, partial [Planctomycetota bacterium]